MKRRGGSEREIEERKGKEKRGSRRKYTKDKIRDVKRLN